MTVLNKFLMLRRMINLNTLRRIFDEDEHIVIPMAETRIMFVDRDKNISYYNGGPNDWGMRNYEDFEKSLEERNERLVDAKHQHRR